MHITEHELAVLNFYRASELHGGLILGQLARRARDPYLLEQLTRHSAEEVVHAQLWTETIVAVGAQPRPVRRTYQARYAEHVAVSSVFQVLALTQVFERRVYRHFLDHARRPATHPIVRATLERMVEEEKDHLSWVKSWLDEHAARRGLDLHATLAAYTAIDERVFAAIMAEYGEDMPAYARAAGAASSRGVGAASSSPGGAPAASSRGVGAASSLPDGAPAASSPGVGAASSLPGGAPAASPPGAGAVPSPADHGTPDAAPVAPAGRVA